MEAAEPSIPIIVLTTSGELDDKVTLFLARLRVALRHSHSPACTSRVVPDGVAVDFGKST